MAADAPLPDDARPLSGPQFVAVGEDGLRAFSSDGKQWTHRKLGKESELLSAACFGGGRCLVAGRHGGMNHFYVTADGINWEPSENDAKYSVFVRNVVFFHNEFLASVSGDKTYILASADGVHWSAPRQTSASNDGHVDTILRRFAMSDEILLGAGDFGRRSITRDGVEWKSIVKPKAADTLIDVTFGNGIFVGGGMHGLRMRSTDGLEWTDRVVGEEGEHINSILWDGKQFVGVGQGATYFSPDAKNWVRTPNTNAPTLAQFGGGVYVGSLWQGRLMRSTDAITWNEVTTLPQHVLGLAYGTIGKA